MHQFSFRQRLAAGVMILVAGVVSIISTFPGWTQTSNSATTTTINSTAPVLPSNFSATVSGATVHFTWTDNADNESGFSILRQNSNGTSYSFGVDMNAQSSVENNLATGTYTYTIMAYNSYGNSGWSSSVSATVSGVTIPASPSGLFVSGSSPTSIGIYWADNSTNESEFRIERRFNGGTWSQAGAVVGNATTKAATNVNTVYTDTNLIGAGTYDYRVTACNSAGCSDYSNSTSQIIDVVAPAVPSGLTATYSSTAGSVTVSWTDNSTNEWGFRLKRRVQGSTSWFGLASVFNNSTGNSVSFTDTYQLATNTTYDYVVRSYNTYESADSNIVTVTTGSTSSGDVTPPSVPTNISATPISSSSIQISWTASTDNVGVPVYRIYRGGAEIGWVSTPTLSYTNIGLSPGTSYSYTVVAVDTSNNFSAQSSPVSATTLSSTSTTTAQGCVADSDCSSYFPSSGATFCGLVGTPRYDKRMKYKVIAKCLAGICNSGLTEPAVLEDCSASSKMCGFSQANGGQFQCVAIPSATCAPNTKITSSCVCGSESSDGTAYSYCCLDSSHKPYLSPFVCAPPPVPGAGAPEPSTNDAGVWAQVDVATGQVVSSAICTKAVCGLNGEWHGYVPPDSFVAGSVWWPTSKRYIWQLPGQAGYSSGSFNFNTYVFTVQGGTIYNGQFTPTVATPTTPSITSPTSTPTQFPTSTLPPSAAPAPAPTPFPSQTFAPIPVPTSTQTPQSTSTQHGEQAPYAALPQPLAVGLPAPASEEKRAELHAKEQFLIHRRAVLQDLRALERFVKRDIIEIDAKQLKIFKEKILSLKPGDEGASSVLQSYREQITNLQGDVLVSSESELTIDPRLEARALRQLKQGLRLFERHMKTLETKVALIEKSGIIVDAAIKETIVTAKNMARQIKDAKTYNDIQDIAEQMPDVGQALNDALPRLEELLRLPRILRLVNRRIADGEKATKQASASAKRLKLEVTDTLETMQGLITEAKSAVAAVKTGGVTDDLLDTLKEQVFDKLDEVFDLADHIRAVASVRQAVSRTTADLKRYETHLRRLKAGDETKRVASELLGQFKEQLAGLKEISTQKLTPDLGDQIIDLLNIMTDLKIGLEEILGLSSPDATQEQIKRLFSAPSEKMKPFRVEELERGVL